MKYQVGDRVCVREDLQIGKLYRMENGYSDTFVSGMAHFAGDVVTIESISHGKYRIQEGIYNWTDEMFKGPEYEEAEEVIDISDLI